MQSPIDVPGVRAIVWKRVGETPLECLERYRREKSLGDIPMTYAGRLDPLAEGELLILMGEECKKKDIYLGFDKEYEVGIVFGIQTDTYDALGLARISDGEQDAKRIHALVPAKVASRAGTFSQSYPPYSSKTVHGKQLHELARANELPDEMPEKEVTIHSIRIAEQKTMTWDEVRIYINNIVSMVKGDFRQNIILNRWNGLVLPPRHELAFVSVQVICSSGTYMRTLAHELGRACGTGAFALSIQRTRIIIPPGLP